MFDALMRPVRLFVLAFGLSLPLVCPGQTPTARNAETTVRAFVTAFNARDLDAMLTLTAEDIAWLSVNGAALRVETSGRAALRESMRIYFEACASCRSEIEKIEAMGSRAAVLERATWETDKGKRSQRSLAIYEFRDGLIQRVYYFAAEP